MVDVVDVIWVDAIGIVVVSLLCHIFLSVWSVDEHVILLAREEKKQENRQNGNALSIHCLRSSTNGDNDGSRRKNTSQFEYKFNCIELN